MQHGEENNTRSLKGVPKAWAAKKTVIVKELNGIKEKPLALHWSRRVVLRERPHPGKASICEVKELKEFLAPRKQQHIKAANTKGVNIYAELSTEFGIIINMVAIWKTQMIKD